MLRWFYTPATAAAVLAVQFTSHYKSVTCKQLPTALLCV